MKHEIITPDGLPTRPQPYPSRRQAERAADKYVKKFEAQGYYKTALGLRIPVGELRPWLKVVPV